MSREAPKGHWAAELRDILDAADRASEALRDVNQWMWRNVVASDTLPLQMPEIPGLGVLQQELSRIRQSSAKAFERYASEPSRKLLTQSALTREEYYVCRAMGVEQQRVSTGLDDYEAYLRGVSLDREPLPRDRQN